MQSDEFFLIIIIVLLAGIVLWYLLQRKNTLAKARLSRAEAINRLIDKFATAKEVTEFLETEQGKKFLEDPVPPAENPRQSHPPLSPVRGRVPVRRDRVSS